MSEEEEFSKRKKDIFNFDEVKLKGCVEAKHDDDEHRNVISEKYVKSDEETASTSAFKGRESLFRVPENEWKKPDKFAAFRNRPVKHYHHHHPGGDNNRGGRKMPDFKKNPQKYTKYSLKDTDLLNNKSNSQAAFSFLREMDERKRKVDQDDDEGDEKKKVVFKKPKKDEGRKSEDKKKDETKKQKKSQMTLSHLMNDDEDE